MLEVLATFARLGCYSFGGPAAHLGYFRREFVLRREWLTEEQFAQCIAITQLLPGPASSQTGMLIGLLRAGWPGAISAWIGFTTPSAVLMTAFALLSSRGFGHAGWLHALLVVAVAVVLQAILAMRRALIVNAVQLLFAFGTLSAMLLLPSGAGAPIAIAVCALLGAVLMRTPHRIAQPLHLPVTRAGALAAIAVFVALLFVLPLCAQIFHSRELAVASRLYDVGSLVFGGGHVVLPLLQSQVVAAGIASSQKLIAGYAAAQAIPGPLFTLSSYIGGIAYNGALGIAGAIIATVAIFLPSFLLIAGIAPFYTRLARNARFANALAGANAGVVGLLASAFVTPIWTNAIHSALDGVFAAGAFVALTALRWPSWIVVVLAVVIGLLLPQ